MDERLMRTAAIAVGLAAGLFTIWWLARHRHTPMVQQKRDRQGHVVKPHTLEYVCVECTKVLGETTLEPKWRLLVGMRRQVPWSRARLRRSA